jgi:recombinational DNA repair ATPase RecF
VRVYGLELRNFRGFEEASIEPHGHVVLVGEQGGGRSELLDEVFRQEREAELRSEVAPPSLSSQSLERPKRARRVSRFDCRAG